MRQTQILFIVANINSDNTKVYQVPTLSILYSHSAEDLVQSCNLPIRLIPLSTFRRKRLSKHEVHYAAVTFDYAQHMEILRTNSSNTFRLVAQSTSDNKLDSNIPDYRNNHCILQPASLQEIRELRVNNSEVSDASEDCLITMSEKHNNNNSAPPLAIQAGLVYKVQLVVYYPEASESLNLTLNVQAYYHDWNVISTASSFEPFTILNSTIPASLEHLNLPDDVTLCYVENEPTLSQVINNDKNNNNSNLTHNDDPNVTAPRRPFTNNAPSSQTINTTSDIYMHNTLTVMIQLLIDNPSTDYALLFEKAIQDAECEVQKRQLHLQQLREIKSALEEFHQFQRLNDILSNVSPSVLQIENNNQLENDNYVRVSRQKLDSNHNNIRNAEAGIDITELASNNASSFGCEIADTFVDWEAADKFFESSKTQP